MPKQKTAAELPGYSVIRNEDLRRIRELAYSKGFGDELKALRIPACPYNPELENAIVLRAELPLSPTPEATRSEWSAKAALGGYYTYTESGRWTGIAASPKLDFRYAPAEVRARIRLDLKTRRKADLAQFAAPCAKCGKPNPRHKTSPTCTRKRCGRP